MTRNVRARSIGGPGQQQHGGSRSRSQMRGMHFIADATQVDTKRWKARLKPDECKPLAHGVPPAAVTILNHGPAKINVTTGSGISFVHAQTSIAPVDTEVIAVRDYVFVETSTESRLCLISSSFSSPATLASQITVPVPGNKAMPDLEPTVAGQKPAIGPSPAVTEVANSNLTNTIPLAELLAGPKRRSKPAMSSGAGLPRRSPQRTNSTVSVKLKWRRRSADPRRGSACSCGGDDWDTLNKARSVRRLEWAAFSMLKIAPLAACLNCAGRANPSIWPTRRRR